MANAGTVQSVTGLVRAIAEDGTERILSAGDSIAENETIITGDGLIVAALANGKQMDVGPNSSLVIDKDVLDQDDEQPAQDPQSAEVEAEVAALQQALADNPNLDPSALPATAAGAGAAGAENNGHSFVSVDYLNPKMDPFSGFETAGRNPDFPSSEIDPGELLLALDEDGKPSTGDSTAFVDEDDLGKKREFNGRDEVSLAVTQSPSSLLSDFQDSTGFYAHFSYSQGNNDVQGGDDIPVDSSTTVAGTLNVSFGSDGPGDIAFNAAGTQPVGDSSGGYDLEYWVSDDGYSLIAYISPDDYEGEVKEVIFTAQITDPTTGDYTTTLYGAVDHADGSTEDNLVINLGYTITDSNGDSAQGVLAYDIDDDIPVLIPESTDTIVVDEDGLSGANADDSRTGETASTGSDTATGTITDDVSWGADGFGKVTGVTVGATSGVLGADSEGATYTIDNADYTLVVQADGDYSLTLNRAQDHATNDNEDIQALLANGFNVSAEDGDGDDVAGGITVNVNVVDDIPVVKSEGGSDTIVVDEDGLSGANVDGSPLRTGETDSTESATASGTIVDNVNWGADGFGQVTGVSVGATTGVAGTDSEGATYTITNADYTLVVQADGDYSLTLNRAQDHATNDNEDIQALLANGFNVSAEDGDGDDVAGGITVNVNVVDDIPVNNSNTSIVGSVHEDALIPDGNGEVTNPVQTTTSVITAAAIAALVDAGADAPITISLNLNAGSDSLDGNDTGLDQGGQNILWSVNVGGWLEGVVDGGDNDGAVVFTLKVDGGDFEFELLENIDHDDTDGLLIGEGDAFTESLSLAGAFIATDSDGDAVIVDTGASVTIENDVPLWINPTTSHLKDVATSPDVVQFLNFDTGADGVGDVVFDTSLEGTAAKDALGNELTFNGTGEPLFIHFSDDGTRLQFVTKTGDSLNTTDVKFYIQLNAEDGTYTVHSEGVIVNGTAVSSAEIGEVGGGNKLWKAFIDLGGTDQDAFLTTNSGNEVNTNNGEIGISDGQSFKAGEGLRIDLLNGVTTTGSGNGVTYDIAGPHNLTNSFRQIVSFVNNGGGGTGANITLSAIIAGDFNDTGDTAANLFFNDADDVVVNLSISDITVYDANGDPVTLVENLTIIDNADGSITIKGLQAGWTFEITSDTAFNAVKIEAATDTSKFKLGVFSYGEDSDGLPIELDYDIIGTDGDGDSVTGSLGVNLYPDGSTFEGTEIGETLTGTANNDYLLGRGGDDSLFGLGGDDLLIGGYGDDEMTGGLGKDSFVFSLAANSGDDIIKDFVVNTDKLNFIDVLDLDGSNTFNLDDVISGVSDADGAITLSLTNGGSVTLEGIGTGLTDDVSKLVTLLGIDNITVDQS